MTDRVYLHVGPHKTGTTFLQQVLTHNRSLLSECGVLFPEERYGQQRQAVIQLLRASRKTPPARARRWDEMAREVTSWRGTSAIISMERLAIASPTAVTRMVEDLAPAHVHVVYTVRDFAQVVPAVWHTHMRNGRTDSWEDYLASLRTSNDTGAWESVLRGQDPRFALRRWEEQVPPDRVHVITVPPPGSAPGLLWERFCSVVDLPAERFSLDVPRVNRSLGAAESELLRLINLRVVGRLSPSAYVRWVQVVIARRVLEGRTGQQRFALPPTDLAWVRERADDIVGFLEDGGYEVTGDLQDILPREPSSSPGVAPDAVEDGQLLDVALDVVAGLLPEVEENARRRAADLTGAREKLSQAQQAPRRHRRRRRT